MKKRIYVISVLFLLFSFGTSFAIEGFIVDFSGEIHLMRAGASIELKSGLTLMDKDVIETGFDSYVSLFMQAMGEKRINACQKYQIKAVKNRAKNFFSISRSIIEEISAWFVMGEDITCGCRNPNNILIMYPRKTFANFPEFIVIRPSNSSVSYDINITDVAENIFFTCRTTETLIRLPRINFAIEEIYNINVSAYSGSKLIAYETVATGLISSELSESLARSRSAIKSSKTKNSSNYYLEAACVYIKKMLYADAAVELKKYLRLNNSSALAKKMLKMSLLKSGFYDIVSERPNQVNNGISASLIEYFIKLDFER